MGRNPHAAAAGIIWPTAHHTLRITSRYWCVAGRNSKKMALSTGTNGTVSNLLMVWLDDSGKSRKEDYVRFPPTPKPINATRIAQATKFGAPPAAIPKIPAMNSVKLKARRLPIRSAPRPQKPAPQTRPAMMAKDKKAECLGWNSTATWAKASETVVCQSCYFISVLIGSRATEKTWFRT